MSIPTMVAIYLAAGFIFIAVVLACLDARAPKVYTHFNEITQMRTDGKYVDLGNGVAWVAGQGLLIWDPNEYELKMVKRGQKTTP